MTVKKSIGPCLAAWLFLAEGSLYAQNTSAGTNLTAREEQIIAAAKPGAAPSFNGATVVGIRPGTPFMYSLAVTGQRPMLFFAGKIPPGSRWTAKPALSTGQLKKNANPYVTVC